MYSYNDIRNIYKLGRCGELLNDRTYPELYNIRKKLQSIIHRTDFFSKHIDDKTSYESLNYVIEILLSLPEEEIELIDHHILDAFTYPYINDNNELINGMNTIFRPKYVEDISTYISTFTKFFGRLYSIKVADMDISKFRKLDVLSNVFYYNVIRIRDYYSLMQLVIAYLYRDIEKYSEDSINYVFNTLLSDEKNLIKIKLSCNFPIENIMEDIYMRGVDKEDIIMAYNVVADAVDKIINNIEIPKEKKRIR